MAEIGVGIIGCGNISTSYMKLIPSFAALEVRAIAGRNCQKVDAQASRFGVVAMSVGEMLSAPGIDVILNLTPPNAHFDITKMVLEAGKHCYSEKPFVLALEDGFALRDLAESKGLLVGSAPDTFMGGAHQLARSVLDAGQIGAVTGATAHVMSHGMERWHPNPDFFFQPGGGPVLDIAPYYLANLVQLLGPVRAVSAMASTAFTSRTIGSGPRQGEVIPVSTPTNIHAIMEFRTGALVTIGASWDVWAHDHRPMEIYGKAGSLFLPDPNFFGGELILSKQDGSRAQLSWDHPFGNNNSEDNSGNPRANYRGAGLADMAMAVAEGRPHRTSLEFALHIVDVMTSILRSCEKRDWIEIGTSCERPPMLSPQQARALLRA